MAMFLVSRTASAMVFPMLMVMRTALQKAEAMEKFSSFDVATRSVLASVKFFSFSKWATAIPLPQTASVFFSARVSPIAPAISTAPDPVGNFD